MLKKLAHLNLHCFGPGGYTHTDLKHIGVFVIRRIPTGVVFRGMRSAAGSLWRA